MLNRPDTYFWVNRLKDVFYLRIAVSKTDPADPHTDDQVLSSDPSVAHIPTHSGGKCLRITAHGLVPLDNQSYSYLHSKLSSLLEAATLSKLSQLLTRNKAFKLTPQDHSFLRPSSTIPQKSFAIPLSIVFPAQNKNKNKNKNFQKSEGSENHGGNDNDDVLSAAEIVLNNGKRVIPIKDSYLFLLYLKQNLNIYLSPLCLSGMYI